MNNAKWIFAVLVLHFAGQVAPDQQKHLARPKIVGGYQVTIKSVPFLVSLHAHGSGFMCGAVIISAAWGLSAMHCIVKWGKSPRKFYIRAGSSVRFTGGSRHSITRFHFINSKSLKGRSTPEHDIVLFRVAPFFRFSDTVKPAKLPAEGSVSPKWLQVSGWGRTDMSEEGDRGSMYVLSANVSKIAYEDCIRSNGWYKYVVDRKKHLCYGVGGADACFGDSGGPLANSNTVYGIVSFGDGCGIKPGIYVDVSFYRRWIKRVTNI